jgi:hypothetical protein
MPVLDQVNLRDVLGRALACLNEEEPFAITSDVVRARRPVDLEPPAEQFAGRSKGEPGIRGDRDGIMRTSWVPSSTDGSSGDR